VEFRADKVERWFPIAVNSPTEKMRKRDRDEQLPGEYERGRIIERIDYQNVARPIKANLKVYLKELEEEQHPQWISSELSATTATREQQCPYCPHCNGQFQDTIPFHNDLMQVTFMLTLLTAKRILEIE